MARLWDGEPGKQRSELALPVSLVGALKERILLGFADRADAAFAQEEKDSIAADAGREGAAVAGVWLRTIFDGQRRDCRRRGCQALCNPDVLRGHPR